VTVPSEQETLISQQQAILQMQKEARKKFLQSKSNQLAMSVTGSKFMHQTQPIPQQQQTFFQPPFVQRSMDAK
jgi:hypothetical protein